MPFTVAYSFNTFRQDKVDLDSAETSKARASRDFLIGQLKGLSSEPDFPTITGQIIHYGSFARRTKIRPLDDIDFMLVLDGSGTEAQYRSPEESWLHIEDQHAPLAAFP